MTEGFGAKKTKSTKCSTKELESLANSEKQHDEPDDNPFDPKELEQCFDGWELYKRRKVPY